MAISDLPLIAKAYDIRGLVPEQLDDDVAGALGRAFADVIALEEGHDSIVVGHDMRASSPGLVRAFAEGAAGRGVDVVVLGLTSTDELYFASGDLGRPGAMFTASHNPARYNGIKFCRSGAKAIGWETGLGRIAERALHEGLPVAAGRTGEITERSMLREYASCLRGLVDLSDVAELRVVVDAGNGMAGLTVPAVLGDSAGLDPLPLEIVDLYFELDGTFPHHEANPLEPANLVDLSRAVLEHDADLGLAFDGDADRCFVIDETGAPISPSAITALVAEREIARARAAGESSPVVLHNLITSRVVPQVVEAAGGRAVRTRVGHSLIKAEMARTGAVFAGEHSAHYYFRDFFGADSGMLAAMHVLAELSASQAPASRLAERFAVYTASGEINSAVDDPGAALAAVRRAAAAGVFGPHTADELDGLTIENTEAGWWFNVRPSNTEPLVRLNCEARDLETMIGLRDQVLALIREPRQKE